MELMELMAVSWGVGLEIFSGLDAGRGQTRWGGGAEIMSWMQQREAIRRAADAGARPRISAQGSQLLPLRDSRLQSVLLSRPNGQLTRAGQFYHSITGRRLLSRQLDESQPLIRDGPNDYILTRGGARKLVRSLQANGQYHVTKLGKAFFKDKFTEWLAHVPVIIRGRRRNGTPYERHDYLPVTALEMGLSRPPTAGAAGA